MRWMYLLPFLVYAVIIFGGLSITGQWHTYLMSYLEQHVHQWTEGNAFLSFLFSTSSIITWIIIKIALLLLFGTISGYLTLIILSPFYTLLSDKIEKELTGVEVPFSWAKFIKDIFRAILMAVRNGSIQLMCTFILFILGFIPFLNLLTAPVLLVITAYFYGFSFLDYSHERMGLSLKESIQEVKSMKYASTTLGLLFVMCYLIPFIGTFIASFISFQLVASGTMLVVEKHQNIKPT